MNDSVTGRAIGTDTVAAQKDVADKFWFDWRALLPTLPPDQQAMVLSWLSLQLAQAAGNGIITHVPGWDLIDFDPSTGTHQDPASDALSFNRPPPALAQQVAGSNFVTLWLKVGDGENDWAAIAGAGASDHKVKRDADATPVYGDELLVSPNGSIGQLNDPESDSIDIQVVCASDLPLPDAPVASAGDPNDQPASIKHVHPLVPSDTYGGKLYTALVPDPLAHAPCDAVFCEEEGCAPILFGSYWTEIATGVWQRNAVGLLPSATTDSVNVWVSMRLMAWSGNISPTDQAHTGPYVLTDTGMDPITHDQTHARMERAADFASSAQALSGAFVPISPPPPGTIGNIYGGSTLQLQTSNPIELDSTALDWEIATPAPAPTNADQLLTAAQLSLASLDTVEAKQDVSSGSGEVELVVCTEHGPDLSGTTLPGDKPWRFHLLCGLVGADDPTATTVIRCYLRGSNDATWHLVATTQPLHNTTYTMWVEAGTLGADYPMAADELLQARFTAVSNSAIGQKVGLVFNADNHPTFIDTPVTIGNSGTDDHQQLIDRGIFLTAGNDKKYGHPQSFIEPGRVHSPYGDIIVTTGGVFTAPRSNSVRIGGTEDFIGIDLEASGVDPWLPGDRLWVGFASARNAVALRTVPSGYGALWFNVPPDPSDPTGSAPTVRVGTGSVMCLVCTGSLWVAASPPAFGNIE